MRKENEIKINSTLTKCVVKAPGSYGAELATIDIINFQKMAGDKHHQVAQIKFR